MRKIIVSNIMSLDGFFEGPNREIDWFNIEDDYFDFARNQLNEVDTLLFGRITYEMMTAYWTSGVDRDTVISHKMNNLQKVVFSRTLPAVAWNNSRLVKENIETEVRRLKQQPGKDMVIFGSGSIVSMFTQKGLIDEYRIILDPSILGEGHPMFKGITDPLYLKLLNTKTLKSGIVILYYGPK